MSDNNPFDSGDFVFYWNPDTGEVGMYRIEKKSTLSGKGNRYWLCGKVDETVHERELYSTREEAENANRWRTLKSHVQVPREELESLLEGIREIRQKLVEMSKLAVAGQLVEMDRAAADIEVDLIRILEE